MKILNIVLAVFIAVFGLVQSANAFSEGDLKGYYMSPKFGYTLANLNSDKSKDTMNYGISIGHDFNKTFDVPVRFELEYLRHGEKKFKKLNFHVDTVMANVAYDIHTDFLAFVPYVMAGAGVAANGINAAPQFACQFGGGMMFPVTDNFGIDLSTKYAYWGKVYNHHTTYTLQGLDTNLGFRYTF